MATWASANPTRRSQQKTTPSGSASADPSPLIRRLASNRHLSRALSGELGNPSGVMVGRADDPAEHAADRLAAHALQQLEAGGGAARALPASSASASIARREDGTGDGVVGREGGDPGADVASTLRQTRGGGEHLPESIRSSFGSAMGADLSGVRVHTDARADSISQQISARAFTTGNDVYFRRGEYAPDTAAGQATLAHELAHVVQGGGEVKRSYLDGKDSFTDATTKRTLGVKRKRSAELATLDDAVVLYSLDVSTDAAELKRTHLEAIQKAAEAWTAKGGEAHAQPAVDELLKQVTAELDRLKPELAYNKRIARHKAGRKKAAAWIQEGRDQTADVRLRNSCEWIQEGRTKFYVVHETHDQKARYAAIEKKAINKVPKDARVYFPSPDQGPGDLLSPVVSYDWGDPSSTRNVEPDADGAGTKGWNRAGEFIVVTEEGIADGKAAFFNTLRHETQHDADKNKGAELNAEVEAEEARKAKAESDLQDLKNSESSAKSARKAELKKPKATRDAAILAGAGTATAAKKNFKAGDEYSQREERVDTATALRRYKTEYRAHWYEGDAKFDTKASTGVVHNWEQDWTPRQWAVFKEIHSNYGYVKAAWGKPKDTAPTGANSTLSVAYRDAIVAYKDPDTEGFNKLNSIRVDDLYRALTACSKGMSNAGGFAVGAVLATVAKLDANDIAYLEDRTQSKMLNEKIDDRLAGAAMVAFTKAVADRKKIVSPKKKKKGKGKATGAGLIGNAAKANAQGGAAQPDADADADAQGSVPVATG